MNGVNKRGIMRQAGLKSLAMLANYIRAWQMLAHDAASGPPNLAGILISQLRLSSPGIKATPPFATREGTNFWMSHTVGENSLLAL